MANKMTNTQYNQVKNESYAVIKFKDGRRVITITGVSFFGVVQEMIENTKGAMEILVINEKDLPISKHSQLTLIPNSRDIADFEEYFRMQRKIF